MPSKKLRTGKSPAGKPTTAKPAAGKPATGKAATAPRHWLMKSEPDGFSISQLQERGREPWNGVRNYQARNYMRDMQVGDKVLFYHSNAKPSGVAGLAEVCKLAYPDPTQFDPKSEYFDPKATTAEPRWQMVDVRFVRIFAQTLALEDLRKIPELAGMLLFQRSRLSVQPVEPEHYDLIVKLAGK